MSNKSDLTKKKSNLTAEQRALLQQRLRQAGEAVQAPKASSIPKRPADQPALLSFAQQRLWFLNLLEPDNLSHHLPYAVRMTGQLNQAALEQSLNEMVKRHEVLRTTFVRVGGEAEQQIAPELTLHLPVIDLSGEADAEKREAAMMEQALEEGKRPFDLEQGPLMRALLIRMDEAEHVLVLTKHHIISDGWSMGVFIGEFVRLYSAFAAGKSIALPELPIQYADYANWQREWLQGDVLNNQLDYWKKQLGTNLPVLQIPTDRPRPAVLEVQGAMRTFMLPKSLTEQLKLLSKQEHATLYMTLLTAFKTLLYRYTAQEEIIVGSPIAGRNRSEIEGLIGFFVNTLVLRSQVSGQLTFRDLLQKVRQITLDAYKHQDVPFEKLVEELQPERNRNYTPLFQVLFVLQEHRASALELPDLSLQVLDIDQGLTTQFDLMLDMEELADGLIGRLKYNAHLYDAETIDRVADHFQTLLEAIAANPDQTILQLPMLSAAERHLLTEWNITDQVYPQDEAIHQRFEAQVERTPDAVALVYEDERLTYRELNERANQLAHHLQSLGVKAESLVGLCVERSLHTVVGVLGILKAGGAYVPLDPTYPQERLMFVLEDSQVDVLVTQQPVIERVPTLQSVKAVCLDSDWETIAKQSTENPECAVTPDSLAYVIYTSGSTGKPKGVLIPHRNVIRLFTATDHWYGFNESDVWTMFHSYAFDFSVWEIWGALFYGGKVVVVPHLVSRSPEAFYQLLIQEKVTVLNQTPTAFRQLMQAEEESATKGELSLRYVIFGGEALELQSLRPWFERHGDQTPQLVNMYGITETTVHVTYRPITLQDLESGKGSVIGRPIPDLQVYVLDAHLQPAPIGITGEMYVGGAGVARGYLSRAELTAERFLDNPLGGGEGRLYKTGDLARFLPNGDLEYQGRIDHQVKIRGFRIELGEIESALVLYEGVREAVVMVREDTPGDKRLVAYLVADAQTDLSSAGLREFLKDQLPEHMVPAYFHRLDVIPLTENGKVDRKALAAIKLEAALKTGGKYEAPVNELQAKIVAIWSEVLQRDEIGIHDNFFDIGGHSLLVVKVHDGLKRELGIDMPITELFQYTTVKSLADALAKPADSTAKTAVRETHKVADTDIAIIGIGLRFPKANTPDEFWENLANGRECITHFPEEELEKNFYNTVPGNREKLVLAAGLLDNIGHFDAEFFQMSEREAKLLDPQQRLFLQCVWEAIEDAGYDADSIEAPISMYAGAGANQYLPVGAFGTNMTDMFQAYLASQPSFMATRVSYKLNLTGGSMMLHTACSTSLVAVHMACKSLIDGEADFALAGGASIAIPQKTGYLYEANFIASPDGHCRAFDKDAAGTVVGNGVGVVLMKRLSDAIRDRDPIYAVIKGTAINNDGNRKVGYTAPGVDGQVKVIAQALHNAGVTADTVSYIEAHGTGTKLGDPIEISALTQVYRQHTEAKQYCAIGSVKTNLGHLDEAAGIAGLIKTALSLHNGEIPPSLHYKEPNPQIDFANSPFYVNTEHRAWTTNGGPRRAGVSSFGIGGTNAHAVLEEAPVRTGNKVLK